ncbi:unnamed protein product [Brassica rapa]|uniref:Uncharacterized protein n=1 Tax=Brassica campestris TaxID=3711 RepID=A0A8D9MI84_BRACM|nr:unnamed protein product [Brassica rapa]
MTLWTMIPRERNVSIRRVYVILIHLRRRMLFPLFLMAWNSTMSRTKTTFLEMRRIYLWQTWRSVFTMVSHSGSPIFSVVRPSLMSSECAKKPQKKTTPVKRTSGV